jgi:hypothetical protein
MGRRIGVVSGTPGSEMAIGCRDYWMFDVLLQTPALTSRLRFILSPALNVGV